MNIRCSIVKVIRFALCTLMLASPETSMSMSIDFSRLNACNDISQVLGDMVRPSTSCRNATGIIERSLRDFAVANSLGSCILEKPPVASLVGFDCIEFSHRSARTTACVRPVSASLISEFMEHYVPKYASRVSSYLNEAGKCNGSNGDASLSQESTFPSVLWPISAHEFGFNVQYGDSRPATSMVSHGFARTSPDVSKSGVDAIEYVVFSDGMVEGVTDRTAIGNWDVKIGTAADSFDPFLKALKQRGVNANLFFFDIDVRRTPRASAVSKDSSLSDELSDLVASRMEVEGFSELSDSDLKRYSGLTREEMSEQLRGGGYFGAPKFIADLVPDFRIMIKKSGSPCTRLGKGAIGVYLFASNGDERVPADFGSISVLAIGFGACASKPGRVYIQNIVNESRQAVLGELENR